jgi:hypothetical protein
VRDGLEIGMRHRLVSMRSTGREVLAAKGTASAGKIGRFDIVALRSGRFATPVSDADNNMKVIAWDVSEDGAIDRKGDASAGQVDAISGCAIGLGMLATAVGTSSGTLKVIVWKVSEAGSVSRKKDASGPSIGDVKICRVGIEHLATAARLANGNLGVDLWHVTAAGEIEHVDAAEAGAIGEARPAIAIFPVGYQCFATSVRDASGEIATILWTAAGDTLVRLNKLDYPDKGDWVTGCALDREVGITAIMTGSGKLKLLSQNFPADGEFALKRGTAAAGSINSVDICRVGVEYVVTAVGTSAENGKLIAWQVSRDGDEVVRRDDAGLTGIKRMHLCQTNTHQFVVAASTPSGNLAVSSWNLRAAIVLHPDLDVSWTLSDALRPVFERVKVSPEMAEGCLVVAREGAI